MMAATSPPWRSSSPTTNEKRRRRQRKRGCRFLGEAANKLDYYRNNLHYVPFGSGRRICAGLLLGKRMLMYVLATFLHKFDWGIAKWYKGGKFREVWGGFGEINSTRCGSKS
ncbi:hypothetical protein Tsubulata_049633 [Turnera subulata]|uniref:Cytochrome P450 n=1 Tax=Turnera subulata TaxID=218843 RepID=A0A9Q0JNN0_9ROSI|nr:hypothetical protein Tsubulata_049633 [Turnera subulata]